MSYKPDESVLMAYLYDELSSEERVLVDHYLQQNPGAKHEMEQLQFMRKIMVTVEDKEVIAPPIVMEGGRQRFFWNVPYVKTIMGIAASLLLLMVIGKLLDVQVNFSKQEFKMNFGAHSEMKVSEQSLLTQAEVQQMINASMEQNNQIVLANLDETQKKFDESIKQNLALNSSKFNSLVKQASSASQDQVRDYVAGLQSQNQEMMKDYFKLTTSGQQKYIEGLLVDFSKYLQQQRNNDLEVLQTRLLSVEQNNSVFKQETEQLLASIVSSGRTLNTSNNY